jgi:pilus assembly protein Flp/PilA
MAKQSLVGRLLRNRKGQGMVEYALLVAGIALVGIVGVSLIGEKTGDMLDLVAVILPGADGDDNGPIGAGHLIETASNSSGNIVLADTTIATAKTGRLGLNTTGADVSSGGAALVVDAAPASGNTP